MRVGFGLVEVCRWDSGLQVDGLQTTYLGAASGHEFNNNNPFINVSTVVRLGDYVSVGIEWLPRSNTSNLRLRLFTAGSRGGGNTASCQQAIT